MPGFRPGRDMPLHRGSTSLKTFFYLSGWEATGLAQRLWGPPPYCSGASNWVNPVLISRANTCSIKVIEINNMYPLSINFIIVLPPIMIIVGKLFTNHWQHPLLRKHVRVMSLAFFIFLAYRDYNGRGVFLLSVAAQPETASERTK